MSEVTSFKTLSKGELKAFSWVVKVLKTKGACNERDGSYYIKQDKLAHYLKLQGPALKKLMFPEDPDVSLNDILKVWLKNRWLVRKKINDIYYIFLPSSVLNRYEAFLNETQDDSSVKEEQPQEEVVKEDEVNTSLKNPYKYLFFGSSILLLVYVIFLILEFIFPNFWLALIMLLLTFIGGALGISILIGFKFLKDKKIPTSQDFLYYGLAVFLSLFTFVLGLSIDYAAGHVLFNQPNDTGSVIQTIDEKVNYDELSFDFSNFDYTILDNGDVSSVLALSVTNLVDGNVYANFNVQAYDEDGKEIGEVEEVRNLYIGKGETMTEPIYTNISEALAKALSGEGVFFKVLDVNVNLAD